MHLFSPKLSFHPGCHICACFFLWFCMYIVPDEALLTKKSILFNQLQLFLLSRESHGFLWVGSSFLGRYLAVLGWKGRTTETRISLHPHPRMKATEFAFSWYSHFNTKEKYLLVLKGLGTPCDCYFATDTFQRPFMSTLCLVFWQKMSIWPHCPSVKGSIQGDHLNLEHRCQWPVSFEKLESWAEMYWSWALGQETFLSLWDGREKQIQMFWIG